MRRFATPLVLLALLTGCATPLVTTIGGTATKPKADGAKAKADDADAAAETPKGEDAAKAPDAAPKADAAKDAPIAQPEGPPGSLGGLTFKALAPENARYAGGVGGPAMTAPAAAPMPSGGPYPMKGGYPDGRPAEPAGLSSGNMNGGYGYAYAYGPGYGGGSEPTALVSLTESSTAGAKGTYQQLLASVVQPVLADWAKDGKLLSVYASTGSDGLLPEPSPAPAGYPEGCQVYQSPEEAGWRLSYYSKSLNEMLNFHVTPAKTLVVRARWAPLDLAAVPVAVDNDAALEALVAAIETPGFQGAEEKSGEDYFMGGTFTSPTPCFGPAIPTPMPVAIGPAGGMPYPEPTYDAYANRLEVVHDVPATARWNVNLQVILGKPVWELSFYAPYEPFPARPVPMTKEEAMAQPPYEDPGFHFNNSARGLVDAVTGTVIRFSRPSKQHYPKRTYDPNYGPYPGPYPYPSPMASAPPPTAIPVPADTTPPSPPPSPAGAAN